MAAGDVLFQLDPNPESLQVEEIRRRVEQAEAKLADAKEGARPSELAAIQSHLEQAISAQELARQDHERRQDLFARGGNDAIAQEELDRSESNLKVKEADVAAIEAELQTARLGARANAVLAARGEREALVALRSQRNWLLGEKTVAAPVDGVVQDTLFRVGELVPAGRPIVSLLPPANIKIRFFVPQAVLPTLGLGDPFTVRVDGVEEGIPAKISFISSQAEFTPPVIYSKESRTKLVFMVEGTPEPSARPYLRPGQPLEVHGL